MSSPAEQMELEDADKVSKSAKRPKGKKLYLINYKVEESTELFLWEVFTTMDNNDHKDLQSKFIVPDTPFSTPPHLDKVMAAECSKSVKSADHSRSHIQALFLDAVGPLTGLLDSINKEDEIVEGSTEGCPDLLGKCFQHTDRSSAILEECNKDLMSFGQDSAPCPLALW